MANGISTRSLSGVNNILGKWPVAGSAACEADIDYAADVWLASCPIKRRKTIHFATDGNDTTGNGTPAAPYQTLAKANAESAPDVCILLRRGDTWRRTGQLEIQGSLSAYGDGPLPRITGCTLQIAASSGAWTNATGDRWTATLADCGYIRPDNGSLDVWYKRAVSTAEVESNERSYYVDGSTVHINAGSGVDPNDLAWEGVPASVSGPSNTGVQIITDRARVDSVQVDHQTYLPAENNLQSYGLRSSVGGEAIAVVSNVTAVGHNLHNLGSSGVTSGGRLLVERCTIGGCTDENATLGVAATQEGGQHTIWRDNVYPFGITPRNVGEVNGRGATGITVHASGAFEVGFFASLRARVPAGSEYPLWRFVSSNEMPEPVTLADCRGIVIGLDQDRVVGGLTSLPNGTAIVSSRMRLRPQEHSTRANQTGSTTTYIVASVIDIDWGDLPTDSAHYAWINPGGTSALGGRIRFVNSAIIHRDPVVRVLINYDLNNDNEIAVESDAINTLFAVSGHTTTQYVGVGGVGAVAAGRTFRGNAVVGHTNRTTGERGWEPWTATVELPDAPGGWYAVPQLVGAGDPAGAICEVDLHGRELVDPGADIGPWGAVLPRGVTKVSVDDPAALFTDRTSDITGLEIANGSYRL